MASNSTTYYNLPVFAAADKPKWLVDWNTTMNLIDSAIAAAKAAGDNAQITANANAVAITGLNESVSTMSTALGTLTTNVTTLTGNVQRINELIGNGTPTTQDKTIIGAINELKAAIDALAPGGEVEADDVSYDNASSGLTATNVQDAIDEIAQGGGAGGADLNFINHATATITPGTGLSLGEQSEVDVLANANYSIGKIYGMAQLTGTFAATVGWNTIATLSNTSLPTISEAYDINCGCEIVYVGTNLTFIKSRLHFSTNGTVDLQLYFGSAVSNELNIGFSLEPCIFIFKNLGD